MFESLRQWFFSRVSERLITHIRSRFKKGPIAAVAIIEFGVSLSEVLGLLMMAYLTWRFTASDSDIGMNAGGYLAIICAVATLGIVGPSALIASELMIVSRGHKSVVSPFVVGLIEGERMTWRYIPLLLIFSLMMSMLCISLSIASGIWMGIPASLLLTSFVFLECMKPAIWRNQSMRCLIASSTPSARF